LAPLGPDGPYGSQQFLERFSLHRGDAAIVVKKNLVAANLTGDDPPAAAENLKLLLTLNADPNSEAPYSLKRIVNVSNRVIATNDNDGPVERLGRWQPGDCFGASLPLTKKFLCVDPPKTIITNDF
jgi:hypothetical protein